MKNIIRWNLGICFGISILDFILVKMVFIGQSDETYLGILFLFLSLTTVGLQLLVNLALSIYFYVMKNNQLGKYFLVSLVVVFLIGVPVSFVGLLL
jgi:hypothetical protein